jgi:hypothetical protein
MIDNTPIRFKKGYIELPADHPVVQLSTLIEQPRKHGGRHEKKQEGFKVHYLVELACWNVKNNCTGLRSIPTKK